MILFIVGTHEAVYESDTRVCWPYSNLCYTIFAMNVQQISTVLEQNKSNLASYGLRRVGIFGSTARGEASASSDIDLLLDFDPRQKTYRNYYASTTLLESLLNRPVDAVTPQALSPRIKPFIDRDITYVQITN